MVLIWISLRISDVEHLFMYLLIIFMSKLTFGKLSVQILCPSLMWLLVFLLLSYNGFFTCFGFFFFSAYLPLYFHMDYYNCRFFPLFPPFSSCGLFPSSPCMRSSHDPVIKTFLPLTNIYVFWILTPSLIHSLPIFSLTTQAASSFYWLFIFLYLSFLILRSPIGLIFLSSSALLVP